MEAPSRNKEARGSPDQGALSLPGLANSKASHMAFPSPFPFSTPAVFLGSISHVSQQAEISQQVKCPKHTLVLGEGVGSIAFNKQEDRELVVWLGKQPLLCWFFLADTGLEYAPR